MKKSILILFFTASLVGMSSAAYADLNSFLQRVNNQALSDIKSFNDRLSRQFGIPVPDVDAIVRSVPKPADAFMVLQLGQMAHVEPAVVLQKYQRNQGKGWGNLAKELGIKPGSREFHALKRGDFSLPGEVGGGEARQGGRPEHGKGKGRGHGRD